jgi:hypothetical protein
VHMTCISGGDTSCDTAAAVPSFQGRETQRNSLLTVHRCTRTHSQHPPPWPDHSVPSQLSLTVCLNCTIVAVHTRRIGVRGRL